MAYPSIAHYTQRPVSWLRPGWGRAGPLPSWLRARVEIARSIFVLPSGERGGDTTQGMIGVPAGYTQDLCAFVYYKLPEGGAVDAGTLDDDNWYAQWQVGSSSTQETLRDGSSWDRDPGLDGTGGTWLTLTTAFPSASNNQSQTLPGQPTDGTGIQYISLGQTGVSLHRPTNMGGGSSTYDWLRLRIVAPTAGIRISQEHTFVARYFANRRFWENRNNPFWAGGQRENRIVKADQPGVPGTKSWYRTENFSLTLTDIGTQPGSVKQ